MEFEKRTGSGYAEWFVGDKYKYKSNSYDRYDHENLFDYEINETVYYEIVSDIISLLKTKGLTVRQAQIVLNGATDALLDIVKVD